MPDIRYLKIVFANELSPDEIPFFRAAIIEKTERSSPYFHNHQGESSFHYRYPLIQYKSLHKKAGILCLGEAIESIHSLFQQQDMTLRVGNRTEPFHIERLDLDQVKVDLTEQPRRYFLKDWQALNQENYRKYAALPDQSTRLAFLEKILTGHLLAFAEGIDWRIPHPIKPQITELQHLGRRKFKAQQIETFSLRFEVNLNLPSFIGLGKGSSLGFGVVRKVRRKDDLGSGEGQVSDT